MEEFDFSGLLTVGNLGEAQVVLESYLANKYFLYYCEAYLSAADHTPERLSEPQQLRLIAIKAFTNPLVARLEVRTVTGCTLSLPAFNLAVQPHDRGTYFEPLKGGFQGGFRATKYHHRRLPEFIYVTLL